MRSGPDGSDEAILAGGAVDRVRAVGRAGARDRGVGRSVGTGGIRRIGWIGGVARLGGRRLADQVDDGRAPDVALVVDRAHRDVPLRPGGNLIGLPTAGSDGRRLAAERIGRRRSSPA